MNFDVFSIVIELLATKDSGSVYLLNNYKSRADNNPYFFFLPRAATEIQAETDTLAQSLKRMHNHRPHGRAHQYDVYRVLN